MAVDTESLETDEGVSLNSPRVRNGSAVKIEIEMGGCSEWGLGGVVENKFPKERWKTCVALMFVLLNFLLTTASLSITHELRDPSMGPLPDLTLDHIPYRSWALDMSEVLILVGVLVAALVVFCHKHRYILIRRVSLMVGLLYGYRAVTMLVTSLPSANREYHCDVQLNHTITAGEVARRVLKIMSGFGLSINGQHVYCGDWIFSGHTMILVLCYLIVEEYTDGRLRIVWLVHWLLAVVAWAGVGMLLVSRGHYTIDVVIAYFVTTRLWYMHNSLIQERLRGGGGSEGHLARLWWWRLAVWLEDNVRGEVTPQFEFPVSLPSSLLGIPLNTVVAGTSKPRTRDI